MAGLSLPAGWARDPTGRNEYRYWDGARWTEHVSAQGVQGTDSLGLGAIPEGAPVIMPGANTGFSTEPAHPRVFTDATAVMGRRFGAFFIDVAISIVVFGFIFFLLATHRTTAETLALPGCHRSVENTDHIVCNNREVFQFGDGVYEAGGGTIVLDALFTLLYFGLLEGALGATVGKLLTGIRVVKPDGSIVGIPRALVRWVFFVVDGPLTLFLCGVITSSVSSGHRRVGDMVAGTYVVGAESVGQSVLR